MIRINREHFTSSFEKVKDFFSRVSLREVQRNVRLVSNGYSIELCASDPSATIFVDIPIETDEASLLLPAARVSRILKHSTGEFIEISTNEVGKVTLGSGGFSSTLLTDNVVDFQCHERANFADSDIVYSHELLRAIQRTVFCCDEHCTRYALAGVQFERAGEKLLLSATDSHRFSNVAIERSGPNAEPVAAVLHSFDIKKLMSLCDSLYAPVEIGIPQNKESRFGFRIFNAEIVADQVEGKFPAWRGIVPNDRRETVKITSSQLGNAILRLKGTTCQESPGVQMTFGNDQLKLETTSIAHGSSIGFLPIDYQLPSVQTNLDCAFLLQLCRSCESDELEISFSASDPRVVFKSQGLTHVMMPRERENGR